MTEYGEGEYGEGYVLKNSVLDSIEWDRDIEKWLIWDDDIKSLMTEENDVAPVVHGRWEWITENLYKCSHCHTKTVVDEFLNETLYMYCPYCGARMDGGESDD